MLLHKKDSNVFTHCLKLLKQFHSHSLVKNSQKYINILDYAEKLEIDVLQKD